MQQQVGCWLLVKAKPGTWLIQKAPQRIEYQKWDVLTPREIVSSKKELLEKVCSTKSHCIPDQKIVADQ